MTSGRYRVRCALTGMFRLDGGAMFGSVPKTLWHKRAPADEENRIELATRSLLIEDTESTRRILVDVGNGTKFDAVGVERFAIDSLDPAKWNVDADTLTDVVITHLHFDHAGGITKHESDGRVGLTFPEAEIVLQRENLDNARAPTAKEGGSYLPENVDPLSSAKLRLVDGAGEIFPEINVRVFHGHTRGLQAVIVGTGPGAIAYPSDLVPMSHHLGLPWIMGYDRCAETTLEEKRGFLDEAVSERWVVVFEHDPAIAAATLKKDHRGRVVIDDVVEL